MRQRRSSIRSLRRHPALAAVALVAMAPMMPLGEVESDNADPPPDEDAGASDVDAQDAGDAGDGGDGEVADLVSDGDAEDGSGEVADHGSDGDAEDGSGEVADHGSDGDAEDGSGEAAEGPDHADPDGDELDAHVDDGELDGAPVECDPADPDGDAAPADAIVEADDDALTESCDVAEPVLEDADPDHAAESPSGDVDEPVLEDADESDAGDPPPDDGAPADPVDDGGLDPDEVVVEPEPVDETDGEPVDDPDGEPVDETDGEPVEEVVVEPDDAEDAPAPVVSIDEPSTVGGATAERLPSILGSVAERISELEADATSERDDGDGGTTEVIDEAGDPGLRAEHYDGVYAQGVPVWVAMTATRHLESRGDYRAQARGSTASGAYQVIDSTWNRYGGYARASEAPPAVQDQFAYESMVAILKRHGNEVSAIPVAWYYPAALRDPALMDIVPVPRAGNVLTPRQYQARWMTLFHQHLEAGSPVFLPADTDPLIPAIAFPVLGPTSFHDDWHAPRDGGARQHEGLDLIGENGQPLRAAFDGVVTRIRPIDVGRPGVGITITRDDGIRANYFHLDAELRWHPDLDVGDTVKAGQVIAYLGDTGNAGIPHLHFELRTDEGEPIAPYPAVLEAIQREQCSVGIGPWSTAFASPAELAAQLSEAAELPAEVADAATDAVALAEVEPVVHGIEGPDGARWRITADGAVTAWGVGALIAPDQGSCTQVPDEWFGTDAAGLPLDLLPDDWWGDDVDPDALAEMISAVAAERSHEFDRAPTEPSSSLLRMAIGRGGVLSAVTRPTPGSTPAVTTSGQLVD